jgi:hypothetical protein
VILLYIDPGAGSMVIQAVLAGVLAIPFFFRSQAGRILNVWRRRGDKKGEGAPRS